MLSAILGLLQSPTLLAIGGGFIAVLVAFFKGRVSGAQKERAKQDRARIEALGDRLEMDRESTAAERQAAGMSDEEARKEALKWARR